MSDLARYHTSMKFDPKPSLVENESATSKRNNSRVPAPNLGKANKIKVPIMNSLSSNFTQ